MGPLYLSLFGVFKKGVCIFGLFLLKKPAMITVFKKRTFIVRPILLMYKQQTITDGELECVPINEEQERIVALMQWIAECLNCLPELPAIANRLSVV